MLCLQDSLVPEAMTTSTVLDCDELRQRALSTHAKCYVENGLCSLSPRDWYLIVRTVGIKPIISSLEGFTQTLEAGCLCLGWYTLGAGLAGIILFVSIYLGLRRL